MAQPLKVFSVSESAFFDFLLPSAIYKDMTLMKTASVLMLFLAIAISVVGYNMAGGFAINAPIITGLGFLVISVVFFKHKH